MLIVIKGAGDLASGVALRLYRAGFRLLMTELPQPMAVRRTVAFSEAVRLGEVTVEGVTGRRATMQTVQDCWAAGEIPVLVDPAADCVAALRPDVVVDAILAKRNLGTKRSDAPVVIALGPGFSAGEDCHAVVETKRGHTLGRVIYRGEAIPNTGVPGNIGGYTVERVLRAPASGTFCPVREIGEHVHPGEVAATVDGVPMLCTIDGVLRGLLPEGTQVEAGCKAGDIDPRCERNHCFTASDKALAIGGGVLEAVLALTGEMKSSGWTC